MVTGKSAAKQKNARPHNHCSPSTLFIQDSTIKEECQSVAPQTYHNQSKISNHLGRLYLLYFFETLENLLVLLMSASFFSPSLLLVTFLQGGLLTATASVLPMADVWMKLSARRLMNILLMMTKREGMWWQLKDGSNKKPTCFPSAELLVRCRYSAI